MKNLISSDTYISKPIKCIYLILNFFLFIFICSNFALIIQGSCKLLRMREKGAVSFVSVVLFFFLEAQSSMG